MKRILPLKAGLILNQLQLEGQIERQRRVFELDDDTPRPSSVDPQSQATATKVTSHE